MYKSKLDNKSEQNIINMLCDHEQISNEQLIKIKKGSPEIGKTELETAFEFKFTDEEKILNTLSSTYSLEIIKLSEKKITEDLLNILSLNFLEVHQVAPFEIDGNLLKISIPDGSKLSLVKSIENMCGKRVEIFSSSLSDISNFIDKIKKEIVAGEDSDLSKASLERNEVQEEMVTVDDDIIEFGNKIIGNAVDMGASDIHIECFRESAAVRYRIDGILREMDNLSSVLFSQYDAIVARIKIISKLDIAERRKPQDGAASFKTDKKEVDLRVSVLPTVNKERVVMRILDKSAGDVTLDELGFETQDLEKLKKAVSSPQGMVLVTGPTGSGKTTTLYSTLNKMDNPDVNIVTIEDPIEYDLDNINQAQVNRRSGVTFASALRAILRQDPDIIMVGEVRDEETVELAIRAALTGHLVFSTIHTNDSAAGFTRLLNWGMEPFLITSTVKGILAQRLVRKLCAECREKHMVEPSELKRFDLEVDEAMEFYKAVGCLSCRNTGYQGRIGLFELIRMNNEIADLVMEQKPGHVIRQKAIEAGMFSLLHDGLIKAQRGDTSLQEILETLGTETI